MKTSRPRQLQRCAVAFELGAARTRIYLRGVGLILDEPSAAALDTRTGRLIAVGSYAQSMEGRAPRNIQVLRPVYDGTVTDIEIAQRMLRLFLRSRIRRFRRRKVLLHAAVCIPYDAQPLVRRAAVETLKGLGTRWVELVDSLIAAATGCGLPVQEPAATMIMECGAESTQVAVLSLGTVVAAERIPTGEYAIDAAAAEILRTDYEIVPSVRELHTLRTALSAESVESKAEIYGQDVVTGVWRTVMVHTVSFREALNAQLTVVVNAIGRVLRACPPDLVADLTDGGMTLTGSSAALPDLGRMIADATGMSVRTANQPDLCVMAGLGKMLEGRE
ncbi:rod shape-determining protein [Streptomyces sp. NPDC001719]